MGKVFVGNFSYSVDDEKLGEYFASIGKVVSARVMREGPGGRSRGFGFVEFEAEGDAERAIAEINGSVWDGRVIKVNEDRSMRRGDYGGRGDRSRDGSGDDRQNRRNIGYFRAQPLDTGVRKKRKSDIFLEDPSLKIDYKDPRTLSRFVSERGRILPRRMTNLTAAHQRQVTKAIKRAQQLGLMPFVNK